MVRSTKLHRSITSIIIKDNYPCECISEIKSTVNKWGSSVIMSHRGRLQFGITIQAGGSQFNIQITPTHLSCAKYAFRIELKYMCVYVYIYKIWSILVHMPKLPCRRQRKLEQVSKIMIKNPHYSLLLSTTKDKEDKFANGTYKSVGEKMIGEWNFKASTEKQVVAKCREKLSQ